MNFIEVKENEIRKKYNIKDIAKEREWHQGCCSRKEKPCGMQSNTQQPHQ